MNEKSFFDQIIDHVKFIQHVSFRGYAICENPNLGQLQHLYANATPIRVSS